jgi:hypothetical protein
MGQHYETEREFGHITPDCFTNRDNRSTFLQGAAAYILYLWHKVDLDPGILGNMLQVLGVAVSIDSDNVRSNCPEVHKQHEYEKHETHIK